MKEIKRSDLHFIGHLRGIDQYEILSDLHLLVLKLGDKYYLSSVDDLNNYNKMIMARITLAYKQATGIDTEALGEEIKVI